MNALSRSAVSQQAGGDSIEYNESPGRADQKEQFSNNDFHVILNLHHRPETEKLESTCFSSAGISSGKDPIGGNYRESMMGCSVCNGGGYVVEKGSESICSE